jgi:hypothetical protein
VCPIVDPDTVVLSLDFLIEIGGNAIAVAGGNNLQRPWEHLLPGFPFCGGQDAFLPLRRFCWSVCRASHTS